MPKVNNMPENNGNSGKITYTGFVLMYIFSYAGIGVLMPLLSQYLAGIGFDGGQIGIVTSMARLIAIFSAAFWGRIFTFSYNKYRVMGMVLVACAVFASFLVAVSDFIFFVIMFGVLYFFQAPVCGLNDSLTVESNMTLGPIRACGSVGYAVFVFAAGRLAESVGLGAIFPFYSAVMLIAAGSVYMIWRNEKSRGTLRTMPEFRGAFSGKAAGKPKAADVTGGAVITEPVITEKSSAVPFNPWRMLIGSRKYILFLVCAFFTLIGDAVNGTYFSFLYIEGGGSLTGVGLAFFLMAGCEAPFMLLLSKFSGKFRIENLMFLAMIVSTARFAWYSTGPSFKLLLATFFLQGFVNSILWVEFIRYCSRLLDIRIASLGISIYYAVASNGSSIVSLLVAGFLLDSLGITRVFAFASVCNCIGLLIFGIFFLKRKA